MNNMLGTALSAALGIGGLASNIFSNRMNQENFERSRRQSESQFVRSLDYISPMSQVRMLRAAGMNPALMNGAISTGGASSGSIPSANPYTPLDVGQLQQIGANMSLLDSQRQNVEANTSKTNEEAAGITTDNLFREENWKSLIYNRESESWLRHQLSDAAKLNVSFLKETLSDRIKQVRLDNQLKDAEITARDINLQYLTPELTARINLMTAQQFASYATGRSSLQQAHAAIMNAVTNDAEMKAQFGDDPKKRRAYSKAIMDGLLQSRSESESREFQNYRVNGSYGVATVNIPYSYHWDKKQHRYVRD